MKKSAPYITASLALLLLLSWECDVAGQESDLRNRLEFSLGPSIPYAEFAESSFSSNSGFSTIGLNSQLEIVHYTPFELVGFYSSFGYATMFFNEAGYLSEYERLLGSKDEVIVQTGNYFFLHLHGGMHIRWPKIQRVRVIIKFGLGYSLYMHPALSASHSYWGDLNSVNRDFDLQPGSTAGINLEYHLDDFTGVQFSYSIVASRPDFQDTEGYRMNTFYQTVRYQNINIGLTRHF